MKNFLNIMIVSLFVVLFSGCGGGGSSSPTKTIIAGKGAKGPFVKGSVVTAYKLDGSGNIIVTDKNSTVTVDALGNYSLSSISWSGPTKIVITGKYFNENTGNTSSSKATLCSIVNVTKGQTVKGNINVFTDLEAKYILKLMKSGKQFSKAETTAAKAITSLFNLPADTNLQKLDLTDGSKHSKANAELLRVSAAISKDSSVLSGLEDGIEDGNITNDQNGLNAFIKFGNIIDKIDIDKVSKNIENKLNIKNAPDANDTDKKATYVIRRLGHTPVLSSLPDITIKEDSQEKNITLDANDIDGDKLKYSYKLSDQTKIDVNISGSTLIIKPKPNQNGEVNVTVKVEDNTSLFDAKMFSVIILPVNDVPVANNDTNKTLEDTNITLNVLSNDMDIDGDGLKIIGVTQGKHGKVIYTSSNITYSPSHNFNGSDSFTYTVSDGHGGIATADVNITVTPVNDAPIANDDINTTFEDSAKILNVLSNDTDVDGDTLSVFSITQPAHGSVTIGNGSLSVIYTPISNFNGSDSFTYTVSDGHGGIATADVNITVTPVNDAPIANDGVINAIKNVEYSGRLNATDPDLPYGDILTFKIIDQNNANGVVKLTDIHTGTFTYKSTNIGDGNFTFKVTDSNGSSSNIAIVKTHVVKRIANITAKDDNISIEEDNNITIDVLANDISVYSDNNNSAEGTTVVAASKPLHGKVIIVSNKIKYIPNTNYNGADSFVYTAKSISGNEDNATVALTIIPVNDRPVMEHISNITEKEDSSDINISLSAKDVDNDSLSFNALSSDVNIVSVVVKGKILTLHLLPNAFGNVDINVTVDDGHGGSDSKVFKVMITPVNDAPVAKDFNGKLYDQNTIQSGVVQAVDVDGDLNKTGYALYGSFPTKGILNFENNGTFIFKPNGDFNHLPAGKQDTVFFKYIASDKNGTKSAPATVTLHIIGLNDAPTVLHPISDISIYNGEIVDENISGVFGDVDDNDTLTYTAKGLPNGVTISSNGIITGTLNDKPGIYDVDIIATDSSGLKATDNFKVTLYYSAKNDDVNNSAWIFSNGNKVVFYPNGKCETIKIDGNSSSEDEGTWDINKSMHAVEITFDNNSNEFFYLSHSKPQIGDTVTDRFLNAKTQSDEKSTFIIQNVINIKGNIKNLNNPNLLPSDINSTVIRIVDGPVVHLFADSSSLIIDSNDQKISLSYEHGYWSVKEGKLILLNSNKKSEGNVSFAQLPLENGILGQHKDPDGDSGLLTVRDIVDINKTDPFNNPYSVKDSEIKRKVMIFTNHKTIHFYDINSSNKGRYWLKGRDDTGAVKESGIYEINRTNGTVDLNSSSGNLSEFTFNSSPKKGTLILSRNSNSNKLEPIVIRKVFGFGNDVGSDIDDNSNSVELSSDYFKNKVIEFTDQKTIVFYQSGFFVEYGLSVKNQRFYTKYGKWHTENYYLVLNYLNDENTDYKIKFNNIPAQGVRSSTFENNNFKYKEIIKKVFNLSSHNVCDAYPEYDNIIYDNSGQLAENSFVINGINYSVKAYGADDIHSHGSNNYNIHIKFYGESADVKIGDNYNSKVVLKVFKNDGTFIGSVGPFIPKDDLDLGDNPFNK